MSCLPCEECGQEAHITSEDLNRWTDSFSNLLASQEGRTRFKAYLETSNLDEALKTLDFWEQCSRVMPRNSEGQDSPPHPSSSASSSNLSSYGHSPITPPVNDLTDSLKSDLKTLLNFACEHVNFDYHEVRQLRKVLKAKDKAEVAEILTRAKAKAAELLRDEYSLFRRSLLRERRALRRC